jgi:hypothetical protein
MNDRPVSGKVLIVAWLLWLAVTVSVGWFFWYIG